MARIYTTSHGEMIDAICRRVYGDESGYVEAVLEANPGLAALGSPLPVGVRILVPEIEVELEQAVARLWD